MEEEEKDWEQPEESTLKEDAGSQDNGENEPKEEADALESKAEKGETIGKFKSVEALYEAYNNLEREFTKKSQRLSQLEKDKTQEEDNTNEVVDKKLNAFLLSNGEAQGYAQMLKDKVLADDALKKMEDPFSYVWAEIVFDKLKANTDGDSVVYNYVLNNKEIKDMVVKDYISQLTQNATPIKIASSGSRVAQNVVTKPANLKDAKNVLFDLFS